MQNLCKSLKVGFAALTVFFITYGQPLAANAMTVTVPSGTNIPVLVTNTISSSSIKSSDTLNLAVAQDVKINNQVVFHQGDLVTVNVQKATASGHFGRPGYIELNSGMVTDVKGEKHPINLSYSAKGRSRRAYSITGIILSVPLILFWIGLVTMPVAIMASGKDAKVGQGLVLNALTTAPCELEL